MNPVKELYVPRPPQFYGSVFEFCEH